jgi:hypothetical protein
VTGIGLLTPIIKLTFDARSPRWRYLLAAARNARDAADIIVTADAAA